MPGTIALPVSRDAPRMQVRPMALRRKMMTGELDRKPVVVVSCKVFEGSLRRWLSDTPATFLDYALHDVSKKLTAALQAALDQITEPSLVIMGYGLCGNGLNGLKAGMHTLVIPRVDDCIALFLGSRAAYQAEFAKTPGTYYLSKGWLEAAVDPMASYKKYVNKYGQEQADYIFDTMYHNYKRLAFVAQSQEDLDLYGPRARVVGEFCRTRLGMDYEEIVGSDGYLHALALSPERLDQLGPEFLVIPPGGVVKQMMFM
jgi:hypothetical protein